MVSRSCLPFSAVTGIRSTALEEPGQGIGLQGSGQGLPDQLEIRAAPLDQGGNQVFAAVRHRQGQDHAVADPGLARMQGGPHLFQVHPLAADLGHPVTAPLQDKLPRPRRLHPVAGGKETVLRQGKFGGEIGLNRTQIAAP